MNILHKDKTAQGGRENGVVGGGFLGLGVEGTDIYRDLSPGRVCLCDSIEEGTTFSHSNELYLPRDQEARWVG